jgi:hypothetical protein
MDSINFSLDNEDAAFWKIERRLKLKGSSFSKKPKTKASYKVIDGHLLEFQVIYAFLSSH